MSESEADVKFFPVTVSFRQLTALRAMLRFQKIAGLQRLMILARNAPGVHPGSGSGMPINAEEIILETLKTFDMLDDLNGRVEDAYETLCQAVAQAGGTSISDQSMVDVIWSSYEVAVLKAIANSEYAPSQAALQSEAMTDQIKDLFTLLRNEQEGLSMAFTAAETAASKVDGNLELTSWAPSAGVLQ